MKSFGIILLLAVFIAIAWSRVDPTAAPQHYNYRDASKQLRRVYYGEEKKMYLSKKKRLASAEAEKQLKNEK